MNCYLGVDAGNSKTVAVVADESGAVLGYGRAGRGDIYGDEAAAVGEVLAAVHGALVMAGGDRPLDQACVRHAAFCLAGLDYDADTDFWRDTVDARLPGLGGYSLRNDGFALLRAGTSDGIGVALSAGTGSAVVARGPAGTEWSASFWIVDPIGGGSLGREAYNAVIRAELGIGPATQLTELVLARYGFDSVPELLEETTRRGAAPLWHPSLAREVLSAADTRDPVSVEIVEQQGRTYTRYALAATRQVGLPREQVTVVLGGSIFVSAYAALREATRAALREAMPEAVPVVAPRSPVVGAVVEALAQRCGPVPPAVIERLTDYRFPPEFLMT